MRVGRSPSTAPDGTTTDTVPHSPRTTATGTDIDLFLYRAGTRPARGQSAGGSADESVTRPACGRLRHLCRAVRTAGRRKRCLRGPTSTRSSSRPQGSTLTATPASQSVTTAVPATVTIGWSGLVAGTRYLGVVDYGDGSNTMDSTIVAVTP